MQNLGNIKILCVRKLFDLERLFFVYTLLDGLVAGARQLAMKDLRDVLAQQQTIK